MKYSNIVSPKNMARYEELKDDSNLFIENQEDTEKGILKVHSISQAHGSRDIISIVKRNPDTNSKTEEFNNSKSAIDVSKIDATRMDDSDSYVDQ